MRARLALLLGGTLVCFGVLSCGTSSAPPPPAPFSPPSVAPIETDEPTAPEPAIPTATDTEFDGMERGELEMLCDQGSTAACDRLGH